MIEQVKDVKQITFVQAFICCFLPFSAVFILTCLYRTMNAVLLPSLVNDLQLNLSAIGFLSATFFLAYGIFQFPIGPLLDKYGPRRVKGYLLLIATLGLILCSFSRNVIELTIAHFLIGMGASGGLIAGFKMIVQWFPPKKFAILNALMMTSGGAGILLGTEPTDLLNHALGWRSVNLVYALFTLIIVAIIFFIVPETDKALEKTSLRKQFAGITLVYKSAFFWRLAPLAAIFLGTFLAFQSLWIESWMLNVDKYSQDIADHYLLAVGIGITVGVLSTGYLATFAKQVSMKLSNVIIVIALLYLIVEGLMFKRIPEIDYLVWFLLGFLSQLLNLVFTIYAVAFPKEYTGRVNSAQNILTYFVAFLGQYVIGLIINALRVKNQFYPEIGYEISLLTVLIIQVAALFWFMFFKNIVKKEAQEIIV